MNDLLTALNAVNGLLAIAMRLFNQADQVSMIIKKRMAENRDHWTDEEKAAIDAALDEAKKRAHSVVLKLNS